jgi:hypothetical protein
MKRSAVVKLLTLPLTTTKRKRDSYDNSQKEKEKENRIPNLNGNLEIQEPT